MHGHSGKNEDTVRNRELQSCSSQHTIGVNVKTKGKQLNQAFLNFESIKDQEGIFVDCKLGKYKLRLQINQDTPNFHLNNAFLPSLTQDISFKKSDFAFAKVIGQFNAGFILMILNTAGFKKAERNIYVVDQHAADEKHLYEKFMKEPPILHHLVKSTFQLVFTYLIPN